MRTIATWIHLVAASLVALGVFVQVYLIAAFATGAGDALDWHMDMGGLVHLMEVLVFLSAIAAFWGAWKWVIWSFLLPVLGTVQIMLVDAGDSGWVNGLHGLGALFVLILASVIVHHDLRVLGLKRRREAGPLSEPPPQPPA